MILLPAVLAGIVVALLRGGSLRHLAALPLRFSWIALLALAAQIVVIYASRDQLEEQRVLHAALLMGSSAALLIMVWANRRLPAMPVLGLGLLLNTLVMSVNGGFMPVAPEATQAASTRSLQEVQVQGARLPRSKDILLPAERTQLWFLSDVLAAPPPIGRVYSIGDVLVGAGVFFLLQAAMVPKGRSTIAEQRGATAV